MNSSDCKSTFVSLSLCPRCWKLVTWRHCLIQQWARALVYRQFHVRTRQTITRIHCSLILPAHCVAEEAFLCLLPTPERIRQHYDGRVWHSSFFSALLPYFMPRRWLQWMGRTCQASFLIPKSARLLGDLALRRCKDKNKPFPKKPASSSQKCRREFDLMMVMSPTWVFWQRKMARGEAA